MKQKLFAVLCALVMIISLLPSAGALSGEARRAAETLNALGVVYGSSSGYELDAIPSRAHAAAVIVRLAGLEDESRTQVAAPFTDTAAWAIGYATVAADKGWIPGTTETTFSPSTPVTANDFFTFLLRLLGYSDAAGDFTATDAALFARRIGLATRDYIDGDFTRGDMFCAAADALTFRCKGSETTIIRQLLDRGAITYAQASSLGLLNPSLTARQAYDRCSAAVFQLDCWSRDVRDQIGEIPPTSNASGFFIDSTGLAVTNYHSIEGAIHATATLVTGEVFPVEKILYYDADIDIAILRISHTAESGAVTSAFAWLEMGSQKEVRIGDVVYNISNPLGLGLAMSAGIVSDNERAVERYALPCIMNTAPISQGSSGGALLNEYGEVIAISSGAYVYGNEMYLSVPIDPAKTANLDYLDHTLEQFLMELPFLD